jgi:hypothetical protein
MKSSAPDTPARGTKWAIIKDRLAVAGVIIALLALLFFLVDGTIVNLRCSFWQFVTFECNRWDARWRPWD